MREETTVLSRRALAAAIPLALAGTARPAAAADDAALLDLGARWAAAWDAQVAHDRAWSPAMNDVAALAHEAAGDRLYDAEHELFDAIMARPARTVAGLAVKAQVLARTHDVEDRGIAAVEKAADGAWELTTRATFSLVLDVLKMAGMSA